MISPSRQLTSRFALNIVWAQKAIVCLVVASTLAVVSSAAAQGDQPDPKALLLQSASTIEASANSSVDLLVTSRMVRGEEDESAVHRFRYSKGDSNGFSLITFNEANEEIAEGIIVRGNGEVTLTWIPSVKRHQLKESNEGIAPFIKSGMAGGIANGLGSLVFGFFTTETISELNAQLTAAEYIALEEVNGQSLHRCRYTVGNDLMFDAWFSSEANPVVIRVQPDLSEMAKSSPAAQQFDNFDYTITFDFANWNLDAKFGPAEFDFSEPEGSELVLSIMEQRSEAPHPLLGVAAPPVELMNLAGEPVNLAAHLGKEVVVLDFWATWCPPCVAALPILDEITSSLADRGVVFYAVDQGEDAETVSAFLEQRGISPAVLLDTEQAVANAYGVQGLPTSVIIGKDGKVQVVHVGFGQGLETKLTKELESLIAGEDLASKIALEMKAKQQAEKAKLAVLQQKLQDRAAKN